MTQRWSSKAGAWLGIGASPAALVLGAGLASRHDGPPPLLAVAVGALLMTAILFSQGLLGLAPPTGENATLSDLAPRYLPRPSRNLLNVALAAAMVGWFGFNVGLGGAALGALLGLPGWAGPLLLGLPVVGLSFGGMRRWNVVAIVATISAMVLGGLVTVTLASSVVPVTARVGATGPALADVAAFVGYVAVFGLRAPDFSVGLASRGDLIWCVGLLVVPMVAMTAAGVALSIATGSGDVVATLAAPGGLAVGNLLIAVAVIAAAFTTTYSGSLALRAVSPLSTQQAIGVVAALGLVLAVVRFDRLLLPWLTILAAVLPPLVIPLGVEAARRRRGKPPLVVPAWTWAPGSAAAVALTLAGRSEAPLAGLAIAAVATAIRHWRVGPAVGRASGPLGGDSPGLGGRA